jgi:mono/diheme cytochrome c family protein
VLALAATGVLTNGAGAQSGGRTVRDGVYTEDQAIEGRKAYDSQCSNCHDGGGMGPALKGDDFLASWDNKPVSSLYTRILNTMPSDAPGTLQEPELLRIIAYLLRANGFSPGEKGFATANDLNDIRMVRSK